MRRWSCSLPGAPARGCRLGHLTDPSNHPTALAEQIRIFRDLYTSQVLTRKTRTISLFGRKSRPRLLDTFLGFELQAGRRRISCPDEATARYLRIFAEMGLPSVEIPYDLSVTLRILPSLEQSWSQIRRLLEQPSGPEAPRRIRQGFRRLREHLKAAKQAAGR